MTSAAVTWQFSQPQFTFSVLSSEYVQVQVTATLAGAPYNPSADAVQLAFKPPGAEPQESDWQAGTWTTTANGTYLAQVLVGPDGFALSEGAYATWVQVTDDPSNPVSVAGTVTITP